ncbi:hypothetical protein [Sphaerisporangium perillae]|uniref:hypothetical protein n=1 Tax=Sphaerisporangium perillae TaxID=2935860 RepID=UPI00200BF434|nr:hypothetical protein [Sphaerisporangium perillae]
MPRLQRHSLARILVSASLASTVVIIAPPIAHADPSVASATTRQAATGRESVGKAKIEPVPAVVVPPNAKADVAEGPSLADRPVQAQPVGPAPPEVTTPAGPALVDQVAAEAASRLRTEGLLTAGRAGADPGRLLPATEQAGVLGVSKAPSGDVGRTAAKVKELAGVDVARLYRALPEGVPLVTYRLCAETASLPVSCSTPRPLVEPVAADVTGDGTPDILASLVPTLDPADLTRRADALADTQRKLDSLLGRTTGGLLGSSGLSGSSGKSGSPGGEAERRRDRQRDDLAARVATGLGLATARLTTSETRGKPLKAQVWAQYDIPAAGGRATVKRLSIGFDGFRRGASLSGMDWGVYQFDTDGEGVADVRVSVRRSGPGASIATVAGIADLAGRQSAEPVLVSLRQSPVPGRMTAGARFDGGKGQGTLKITVSEPSALNALVLDGRRADRPSGNRFTQVVLDKVTSRVTAQLIRQPGSGATQGGGTEVRFVGSAPMGRAELRDYVYRDGRLDKVVAGSMTGVPADFRSRYEAVDGTSQTLTVTTAPRAKAVQVLYFDRAAARTVFRTSLTALPARMQISYDIARNRVIHTASSQIGGVEVLLQRDGGAISDPEGSHVTVIKDGGRFGVSGRLSALAGFDLTYGEKPHATLELGSAGRPFLAAAGVDGTHLLRMEMSNTPHRVEVDLDPAARKARYQASGAIGRLRAAYADTRHGPTIDSSLYGLRSTVEGSWQLGERPTAELRAASGLKKAELYANRAYVTNIAPTGTGPAGGKGGGGAAGGTGTGSAGSEDLRITVRGVHRQVAVLADLPGRRLDWTADRPVDSVAAFARARYQGRYLRVAAKADDVPARFEAEWGDGTYRFRGISGPVGSATVAVTNHDGARAPSGPHLAAHYSQATGDLDGSVRVDGLSSVEFGSAAGGFKAGFQAARQTVALDADVYLAGDLRFGALGRLGPVPGGIEVTAAGGGPVTYSASGGRMDLKGQVWLGKVAAISGISGVPEVASGVTLADGGCTPGSAGCAADQGPFCAGTAPSPAAAPKAGSASNGSAGSKASTGRGCFGVRGFVHLRGLPSKVTVDPARKTFSFSGYRPRDRRLSVYLDSKVVAPVPIKAFATLDGLPRSVTGMSVGPFETGRGKDADGRDAGVIKVNYRVEPAATITSLRAVAEADTGDAYGIVRGEAVVDPVPAAVAIDGTYGGKTHIRVQNSSAVKRLVAKVTVLPRQAGQGAGADTARPVKGTGMVRLADVPAGFTIDAGDTSEKGLRVPRVAYKADGGANTLDGIFAVEGALVPGVYQPRQGELLGASFAMKDLASDTTIRINPDLSVDLASKPVATKLLEVHAGLSVSPVARQRIAVREDIPYTNGFLSFQMNGDFALQRSTIQDVSLGVHGMSWLRIRPGRIPFGMRAPGEFGYVSPGFEGNYDHLDLRAGGVDLRPDVRLDVRIARDIGKDVFKDTLELGSATSLEFRRYDQRTRPISAKQALKVGATPVACLTIDTKPGLAAARRTNSVTLRGADGPQVVSLLDPGGQVQGYALDLLSQFMSPFDGAGWKVSGLTAGRCR